MALSAQEIRRRVEAANAPSTDARRGQSAKRSEGQTKRKKRRLDATVNKERAKSVSASLGAAASRTINPPAPRTVNKHTYKGGRRSDKLGAAAVYGGATRAVANTVRAIGETTYDDPVGAAGKTVRQGGDIIKGLASAAIGLPVYAVTYPAKKAVGADAGDSPLTLAKNMVGAEGKRIKDTYGPSYRGDKKAYAKLKKQVAKEGPLLPALDVATVLAPAGVGLGAAARGGALGAKVQKASTTRAPLRKSAASPAKPQKVRKSAIGVGVTTAHDAARKVAQRTAKARAEKRLRVRAAEKVTGKPLSPDSLLYADPKGLSLHRAALKPGEVTPIRRRNVKRSDNLAVATEHRRGEDRAALRIEQHITGRDRAPMSFRESMKQVEGLEDVVEWMRRRGVDDAKGAAVMIPARRAEIARSQVAALAGAGKQGKADQAAAVKAESKGLGQELAIMRRIEEDPTILERPEVKAAVAREVARGRAAVTKREGLSDARGATGRAKLAGATLGVKRADEINDKAKAARNERVKEADAEVEVAKSARDKTRITGARVLAGARADLAKAKGRAEILSRNVTGRQQQGRNFAGGAHGVREAERALAKAQDRVSEELSQATLNLKAANEARSEAAAPIKRAKETPQEYEARVAEVYAEAGLRPPEHGRSTFETDPDALRVQRRVLPGSAPQNPLAKERKGTLYRLGQEDFSPEVQDATLRANLRRGALLDSESRILEQHGLYFKSPDAANKFIEGLGVDADQIALLRPVTGLVRKESPAAARRKDGSIRAKDDAGDYARMNPDGVFLVPKHVSDQLDALDAKPSRPAEILRKMAQYPQGAILALSPSWMGFQRVNDVVASTLGGSVLTQKAFAEVVKGLDPDSREVSVVMSGRGSMASEFLGPTSGQRIGRMQRIVDENPTYRDALSSSKPATNLLLKGAYELPTALLRADAKITGGVRERQFLHNLLRAAARMDPDVKSVAKGFGPMGLALKTGDVQLMERLLKDPKYAKARDDAVEALTRIHGDWHNYTAAERKFKSAFAFYGFLRYATKMALYTLPANHPHVALLLAQIGAGGSEYSKSVIGEDMPWRLGALYNKDGTIAADFSRANPLSGPLFSVTKPEQALGLLAPPVAVGMSYLLAQPVGLSDSSEGYISQFTVGGDPQDHAVGGFTGTPRLRIAARNVMSWLYPFRAWQNSDTRPQSSDSLPFSRRPLQTDSPEGAIKLEEKRKATPEGFGEILHDLVPFLGVGSKENVKEKGQQITRAKQDRAAAEELRKAKRHGALHTPVGRARLNAEKQKAGALLTAEEIRRRVEASQQRFKVDLARKGLLP